MEENPQQLKELLEAEKQEFLSVMSHELRTPMTGVKGYLSMILDGDAGEISADVREYIAQAYVANDKLIRLVDRMAKTVALQEGKIKLNIQKVNLVQNLEVLTNDFQFPAKDKGLTLTYEKPAEPIFVTADPDRLREVLLNLISNAIKFTPTPEQKDYRMKDNKDNSLVRGFTDKGSVKISHRTLNSWAVVDVTDTGQGIKKQDQDRIFQIFNKVNLALAGQEKGTGLGLFLARKLAEEQGGKVWLEASEEGKGSTFSAGFPKAE